jgi:two-component system, OmpR family, sensor kinase
VREIAFVRETAEHEDEQQELERLDRMQALFREVDRAVERVLLLDKEGRRDEAVALFRSEIENRLDAEFEQIIAAAVAGEREEVAQADATAAALERWLAIGTFALLGLLLAGTTAAGVLFARSLRRPIEALTQGTIAVEQGDLSHRILYSGPDELGRLARQFNAMLEVLQQQRTQLDDVRAGLERQVSERTGELAELNRRLVEVDRQRVRFLADISHELRTPLTALRGEAEVTLRGASRPEDVYRDALASIVAQAAAMGRLVDDLLFLARSDSGEIRFDFRRVPLAGIISEAARDVAVLAHARDIRIRTDPVDRDLTVRADERRLKQALSILLDNAVKYSGPRQVVDIGIDDGSARQVAIYVRDRGHGIEAGEIGRVFDRFYRAEQVRRGAVEGSGLGLPIARWIVEKHRGTIDLTSVPGEGTEVRMHLPREVIHDGSPAPGRG